MHQRGVIHRDLKMGNIFIDSHMDLKIGDFGLAAVVLDERERRTTLCGTPNYIAPEILAKSKGHDHKVDTWAVGIICYAMLIGAPPFASKTQPEIYAKLKQLQYEWKTDSKNFIPPQAKDLVTTCLNLEAANRPDMDDLVEHAFFRMGAVAEELDTTCCRTAPMWLELADPRGDKVRPGYGTDHTVLCEACGVGKNALGVRRPSVGGNGSKSAMAAVDIENKEGRAPTIPLPPGMIYKQFAAAKEDWMAAKRCPVGATQIRSRKTLTTNSQSFDIADIAKAIPHLEESRELGAMLPPTRIIAMPVNRPRTVQSFAAQQRQQALPSRVSTRVTRPGARLKPETSCYSSAEEIPQAQGYLKERPVRSNSVRLTRSNSVRETIGQVGSVVSKSSTVSTSTTALSSKASTLDAPPLQRERPATAGRPASRYQLSTRTSSKTVNSEENALIQASSSISSTIPDNMLQATMANDHRRKVEDAEESTKAAVTTEQTMHRKRRIVSAKHPATSVPNSTPPAMLASLNVFYNELAPIRVSARTRSAKSAHEDRAPHPVVQQWVDYTDKYGIGYILSDDTVGLILRSSENNTKASSCALVRNAKSFYRRRCKKLEDQLVPQGACAQPVEFYETCGEDGMLGVEMPPEKFQLDTAKYPDPAIALSQMGNSMDGVHDEQKVRMLILLDKFAKYMLKSLGRDEVMSLESDGPEKETSPAHTFLKFYQRLGNVGIFGFGSGALQFNFPDHTKMVIYPSSARDSNKLMLDLYHLQPEDAVALASSGTFQDKALQRRGVLTLSVRSAVERSTSSRDGLGEIIRSNEVKEKLAWVRGVVGRWVKNGGLGRMGEERIGWMGLGSRLGDESVSKTKLIWVSVGREGGDGD